MNNKWSNSPINWTLSLVTPPDEEPVTLSDVKGHLRVDWTDEDNYISGLITAARMITEERTCRALITQTWDFFMDSFPRGDKIHLPKPNLQSVTSLKYIDSAGVEYTWDASNYIVDDKNKPGRVVLTYANIWPTVVLYPSSPVAIRYVAGYGTAADVPQPLKNAILFLVSHWYENREIVTKDMTEKIPMTFDYLIGPYKVWRFY